MANEPGSIETIARASLARHFASWPRFQLHFNRAASSEAVLLYTSWNLIQM